MIGVVILIKKTPHRITVLMQISYKSTSENCFLTMINIAYKDFFFFFLMFLGAIGGGRVGIGSPQMHINC